MIAWIVQDGNQVSANQDIGALTGWSLFLLVEVIETLLTLYRESRDTLNIQRRKDIISHRNRSPQDHSTNVLNCSPHRGSLCKIQYNTVPYRSERASEASGVPPLSLEKRRVARGDFVPATTINRLQKIMSFFYGLCSLFSIF